MENTKNIYDELIMLYQTDDDSKIFTNNGMIFSTDMNAMIVLPKDEIIGNYIMGFSPKNLSTHFPKRLIENYEIGNLGKLLELVPKIKEVVISEKTTTCNECNGNGTVQYVYSRKNGKENVINANCPECQGQGEIEEGEYETGKLIPDPEQECVIKNLTFFIKQINRLYETMRILGEDKCIIYFQDDVQTNFKIGDVHVVIASCVPIKKPVFEI
jgi:hypothetical protein